MRIEQLEPAAAVQTGAGRGLDQTSTDISIRRLQVFWAIAHTGSMTRAAKMLGVTQPSLSQQLSALEAAIGGQLFDRRSGQMQLTELGSAILARAEQVLRSVQDLEDLLPAVVGRPHHSLRIAGAGSVMRTLLPQAIRRLKDLPGSVDFDLFEGAPGEVLESLHARRANIGILAAASLPDVALAFRQVTIFADPYVLAVPEGLDLDDCQDLAALPPDQGAILNATAQLVFGTHHARRIQEWYDRVLPANRILARTRNYETMIEMARARLAICIAPALVFAEGGVGTEGLRLYHTGLEPRRIQALFPAQYQTAQPHAALIAALTEAGRALALPDIAPMPPAIARALADFGDQPPADSAAVRV